MKYLLFLLLSCNIPLKKPKENNRDESFKRIKDQNNNPINPDNADNKGNKNPDNKSRYKPTLYSIDNYFNMIIDKNRTSKNEAYLNKEKKYVKTVVDNYVQFNEYTENNNMQENTDFPDIKTINDNK